MAEVFSAFFTSSGAPATGLTPTIKIYKDTQTNPVVLNASMSELGGGLYAYNYESFVPDASYSAIADGGDTLSDSDRYAFGATDRVKPQEIPRGGGDTLVSSFSSEQYEDILNRIISQIEKKEINIPVNQADQLKIDGIVKKLEALKKSIPIIPAKDDKNEKRIIDTIEAQRTQIEAIKAQIESLPALSAQNLDGLPELLLEMKKIQEEDLIALAEFLKK